MRVANYLKRMDPVFIATEIALHAAKVGYWRAQESLRRPRPGFASRKPGTDTPLWNLLATHVRRAARPYGAKANLARYLGLPRQRLTEYLSSRKRLPDAEITLRLLHWLEWMKRGRNVAS